MAYTTLAKLKGQLGISSSDATRDTLLTDALNSVSAAIDNYCDRSFTPATGVATLRTFTVAARTIRTRDGFVLSTPDIGSTTGLAAAYGRSGTFNAVTGDLELYPLEDVDRGWAAVGILLVAGTWPLTAGGRMEVTADWGWPGPDIYPVVEQATLLQASRIFKRKDSPEGVLGSAEWGAVRVSRVDPDVESMLAPLRRDIALVG